MLVFLFLLKGFTKLCNSQTFRAQVITSQGSVVDCECHSSTSPLSRITCSSMISTTCTREVPTMTTQPSCSGYHSACSFSWTVSRSLLDALIFDGCLQPTTLFCLRLLTPGIQPNEFCIIVRPNTWLPEEWMSQTAVIWRMWTVWVNKSGAAKDMW